MSLFHLFSKNSIIKKDETANLNDGIVDEDTQNVSADHQDAEETYEILEREILPTKIICPDCGGITLEGLEYCDKCGGELQ